VVTQFFDPALPLIPVKEALERAREHYRQDQGGGDTESLGIKLDDDSQDESAAAGATEPDYSGLACGTCGLTFDEFRKEGRLGCAECYDAFADPLKLILFRIHGEADAVHKGRRPGQPMEGSRSEVRIRISQLQRQMLAAVEAEAYERAAGLRDQIAELERRMAQPASRA
jgi:protein-arginine kinase activator protein McsA